MNNDRPRTLQDVVLIAKEKHGGGGRRLARIATAPSVGHKITATTIDAILAGKYTSRPSTATLDALAYLSGESKKTVYGAAGVIYNEVPIASQLPEGVDELDVDQRRTLITVARTLVHQARENHRLQLELQAQRKEQNVTELNLPPMTDEQRTSAWRVVFAALGEENVRPCANLEEAISQMPEGMREATVGVIHAMQDNATDDWGSTDGPEQRDLDLAADDADGLSAGQRARAEADARGEESQDPGEQQ